jgi:RNA-directed DNA polymerase
VYDADLKGYFDTIPHDQLMKCLKMRITDRSVLKLIRMWLESPVIERRDKGRPKVTRPKQGTPQGGVISPLLANIYLHWFEKAFHAPSGPARWAKAKIVRYADDFVILARYQGQELLHWVEDQLEGRFRLTINREKTHVVNLNQSQSSVDFLGFTFRYDRDLQGRGHRYLNVFPSKKALARSRDRIRELTSSRRCFMPIPELIGELNVYLAGWANYFRHGYPRMAMREVNRFVGMRLTRHLKRRSQRPFRPSEGVSFYAHLQALGLRKL